MKESKSNRLPIVLGILVIVLSLILWGLVPGSGLNQLVGTFTGVYRPVAETVGAAGETGRGFFSALINSKALQEENRRLTNENASLQKEVRELKSENEKYQELKAAFAIKDRYAGYEIHHAAVISRSFGNLFDMFSINMGTVDGLDGEKQVSYPVLDADMNLVGRIDHVSASSAKVLPLISDGFTVVARVNRAGGTAMRVHGDVAQAERGLCLVDGIKKDADIKVGDELVTDGSGGLFPPGLKVGTIVDVMPQGDELLAILKPYSEVRNLADVFVLIQKPGYTVVEANREESGETSDPAGTVDGQELSPPTGTEPVSTPASEPALAEADADTVGKQTEIAVFTEMLNLPGLRAGHGQRWISFWRAGQLTQGKGAG